MCAHDDTLLYKQTKHECPTLLEQPIGTLSNTRRLKLTELGFMCAHDDTLLYKQTKHECPTLLEQPIGMLSDTRRLSISMNFDIIIFLIKSVIVERKV